jgi:hypothetical protein
MCSRNVRKCERICSEKEAWNFQGVVFFGILGADGTWDEMSAYSGNFQRQSFCTEGTTEGGRQVARAPIRRASSNAAPRNPPLTMGTTRLKSTTFRGLESLVFASIFFPRHSYKQAKSEVDFSYQFCLDNISSHFRIKRKRVTDSQLSSRRPSYHTKAITNDISPQP